ncbi:hypothetical protein DEO72_LG8g2952 [Vigna unguiculata]|uniref:Uncharacterized protein n=1 Tax=Vigna unguiculata TaxID=3917 RepID=A0A4D6MW84_VIGUN|nr:hypothetical protein DEO72_LG8g2952 [Vigna unguiculata]
MAEAGCPALTLPNQFGEEWWWMPEVVNGNERSLPVIEKCGGSGANQNPYSTRFGADAVGCARHQVEELCRRRPRVRNIARARHQVEELCRRRPRVRNIARARHQDENIKTRSWIETIEGKKKGRLYGASQLVSKYTGPNESLNQVPVSSSSNTEDLTNIRQQLSRNLEENEQLRSEFRSFQSLVLQYLPPDAQARLQQPQPQPQPQPQQPNPTQPNSEIPPPHSQQQNNEEDDNLNEESSPDYEDY